MNPSENMKVMDSLVQNGRVYYEGYQAMENENGSGVSERFANAAERERRGAEKRAALEHEQSQRARASMSLLRGGGLQQSGTVGLIDTAGVVAARNREQEILDEGDISARELLRKGKAARGVAIQRGEDAFGRSLLRGGSSFFNEGIRGSSGGGYDGIF